MLFAAVGGRCGGARLRRRIYGRCCLHALFAAVGGRCGGARLRRRICGCCCSHAICRCWGWMLGSETAETNLRTMLLPCCLQLLGVDVRERDCGDESVDAAVTMLFAAVGGRCGGARLRRRICKSCCYHAICIYLQLLGVDVGERDCGEESADAAAGGCCCAIKGSRFWTPYFLHLNGCCCGRPCCGRCWVRMLLRNIVLRTMLV